jgi:hypothetical protein
MLCNCNSIISGSYFRNTFFILLLFSASFSAISGQGSKSQTPPLRERLFFGGSFGLQFGTITDIDVSPIIGLWVFPRVAVGIGPEYTYYKDPLSSTSIYGGRVYSELVLIQDFNNIIPVGVHMGLFLHAENESLSLESDYWKRSITSNTPDRFLLNTVLAGGGISQQLGRRSSINFIVLWPLNSSAYDYYSNPEIRVSLIF